MNMKYRLGDTVRIVTGRYAGKIGTVSNINVKFKPDDIKRVWSQDDCCEVLSEGRKGIYANIEIERI